MMGFIDKDTIAIASFIHLFEEQVLPVTGRPTEVSPDRVVKEITKCPFRNFPPGFRLIFLSLVEGFCEAINPEYKLMAPKRIPEGDPIYQWIVEKR